MESLLSLRHSSTPLQWSTKLCRQQIWCPSRRQPSSAAPLLHCQPSEWACPGLQQNSRLLLLCFPGIFAAPAVPYDAAQQLCAGAFDPSRGHRKRPCLNFKENIFACKIHKLCTNLEHVSSQTSHRKPMRPLLAAFDSTSFSFSLRLCGLPAKWSL